MHAPLVAILLIAPTVAQAGVHTVPLDPADPDPIVALSGVMIRWNEIHFELTKPGLQPKDVKLTNENCEDQHWSGPTEDPVGSGKYSMAGVASIEPHKGAGLVLQSATAGGWANCNCAMIRAGKTVYPAVVLRDK